MTGKKALERLKADAGLVARSSGLCTHKWADGRLWCYDEHGQRWRDGGAARSEADFIVDHWTLYRAKKQRDVFTEPRPNDFVSGDDQRYKIAYSSTGKNEDLDFVWLWNYTRTARGDEGSIKDHSIFACRLTRAEFAARAKPPFSWTVVSRAT